MEAATTTATYVYGVVRADHEAPNTVGIDGAQLKEVTSSGLAALVSDMPFDRELVLGKDEMTTHARVLEEALQSGTVLPMRFGVVMAGEPVVKEHLLEAHRAELEQQLNELDDKVELRVRAVYDEDNLLREVLAENPDIARQREATRGQNEDATYYARIQLGEMVAQGVDRKREQDASNILEQLAPLAAAVEVGEPANERIVITASFLVERERMGEFDQAVDLIGQAQATRMRIKYTGPLPPHSFVQLSAEG